MFDPTAAYRTAQITTASPASQIVLLYQGAIRFASQHLAFLENKQLESAHKASIRAQEVVSALRGSLDMSAGPIATQLDQLYEFVLRRLIDGNVAKTAEPTVEAISVLRGLLEAWQEVSARPTADLMVRPAVAAQAQPIAMGSAPGGIRVMTGGLR